MFTLSNRKITVNSLEYDFFAISGLKLSVISHIEVSGHVCIHFLLHLLMAKTKPNIFLDEHDDRLLYIAKK